MNSNHKSILAYLILGFATLFALGILFASGPQKTEASSISGPTFGGGFNCTSSRYDIDFHFECRDSNTNNLISCDWDITRQCTLKPDGFYHNDFKSSWYADRCWSGSGTGSTFDFCPGGCNMDWKVDVSKTNYVSLASYYPGGDGSPGKTCTVTVWSERLGKFVTVTDNNCPLLYDLNGTVANWTVKLTPSCTNVCTAGAKQCSTNTVQECRDTNNDTCTDTWVDIQTCTANATWCSGANLCSSETGCWNGGCYDNPDTCSFNATCNQGTILGRIWIDANMNGGYDAGEGLVQDGASCGAPSSFTLAGTNIQYSGASTGTVKPNACDPPHYITGQITAGNYTVRVSPPEDWAAVAVSGPGNWTKNPDKSITGNLPPWSGDTANWKHVWFGIARNPVAEASISKTSAGPWSNVVIITNAEPAVDTSKDPNFYLSALIDRNRDGTASYDPKGGLITCMWDYDTGNPDLSTEFTGCQLGEGEYTETKRQEMVNYWKTKVEASYKDVIQLTVTDQYGLIDTDFVGIIKEEAIPPTIKLLDIQTQCDVGTPLNILKWEAGNTTSYEIKYCDGTNCDPTILLESKSFTANPIEITHRVKDKTQYLYTFVAHGPGGDTVKTYSVLSRNCKGNIVLATYLVNSDGKRLRLLPGVTVKLTNTAGTQVLATTVSDRTGFARFEKLIPGTYGVLGYKEKNLGYAKQAGDCLANTYTTANATIGPSATTEGLVAAWDNKVPVVADSTTYCHDLGFLGIQFLLECEANPNPAQVKTPVTWTAKISGREPPYTISWSGSEGLTGNTQTVTKTYDNIGTKSAFVTVAAKDETKTAFCSAQITGPPVCDPNEFLDNKFNRCLFDYNFNTSPASSTVSNGTALNVSHEPLLQEPLATPERQIGSAVAFDYSWRSGTIDFSGKSDNVGGEWRGTINFKTDDYKFIVDSDDGVELTVDLDGDGSLADESPVINEWHKYNDEVKGHYESNYYSLNGKRKVLLRWFEDAGEARIRLLWYNRTCHMTGLKNRLHACFYKGTDPFAGEFIGERDVSMFGEPASSFSLAINNDYRFGGEFGVADNFSGFYRGIINFTPGFYKFKVETDDGARIDVGLDGIYEINEWRDHSETGVYETGFIPLGGDVHIQLEWYEKDGPAKLKLTWSQKTSFLERVRERLLASLLSLFVI